MFVLKLILKEILHRKSTFLLSLVVVAITVALFICFYTTGEAFNRETKRIMRDMGQNLRIIPGKTEMGQYWSTGFSEYTMPEEYVYKFKSIKKIVYTHLTALLQKKVMWQNKNIILTGILPEVLPLDKLHQKPMTYTIKLGTVYMGYEIAHNFKIKTGDLINIFGKSFSVAKSLPKKTSDDDIRIYGHLHDVQSLLNMKGDINEIRALECVCLPGTDQIITNMHAVAQRELDHILPDTKVILLQFIADIRQKQRAALQGYLAFIMPLFIIVCSIWIGFLALNNVKERRTEIGIMRAVGYGSFRISMLFLGKAVLIGIIGAVVGFFCGTALALEFSPDIFKVTAKAIKPEYRLLGWVILAAPLFTAIASLIPTMIGVIQDPASTLREV